MDHQGEDCIAVGSTGTLLSLMGKEMEILQARRSCSVSYSDRNYKKSPSSKDHINTLYASNVFGYSPASPLMNPPSTSILSSLWTDLKGLLRSPTSIHHSPLIYHNNARYSPLIYYNNSLFCKELEINEDSDVFCNKSPPAQAPAKRTYPKKGVANSRAPAQMKSPSSKEMYPKEESSAAVLYSCPSQKPSRQTYPKEKVATEAISNYSNQTFSLDDGCLKKKADYPHRTSALQNCPKERLVAGAADYPNWKSPLHNHSQERSAIAYANGKDTHFRQVITATGIHGQESSRKGNPPKERSLAGAAAANPNLQSPKGKAMDAASPNLQYPAYPKAKAMDAVYAMRRRLGSTSTSDADSQNGKVLQEEAKGSARTPSRNRCSRKGEESTMQDECCNYMQKREERGIRVQNEYPSMQKREERECMQGEYTCRQRREERGSTRMQEYECCMKKPMLEDMEPCTPATSPVNMQSPCFKPSRSFGGRSVSVVDLQCCHTATSRERSSRRLSFIRLASF